MLSAGLGVTTERDCPNDRRKEFSSFDGQVPYEHREPTENTNSKMKVTDRPIATYWGLNA